MNLISTEFFLRPLEPLFFGAPRPFNAGEAHHARSDFPPSPMAWQGIVRSHLLRSVRPALNLDDWSRGACGERAVLVGTSDRLPEGWQLSGPLPAVMESSNNGETLLHPWAPVPRFVYRGPGPGHMMYRGQTVSSTQPIMNDLGQDKNSTMVSGPHAGMESKPLSGWVDSDTLLWALSGEGGQARACHVASDPPFIMTTQQPGIALDRKGNTAQDGMLYLQESIRFSLSSGLWGSFVGTLDDRMGQHPFDGGVSGAGRKGRLAAMEKALPLVENWLNLFAGRYLPETIEDSARFWLYLLTPVRIQKEEEPARAATQLSPGIWLRGESLPAGTSITCLAALTGPPLTLGGMDMARGRPRPNHAYVPAGSAWLIKIQGADKTRGKEVLGTLHNTHPLGDPEEARFGFGHTLVGIGPETEETNHDS